MICSFDALETYSDKTKDFAWYFQSRLWFVDLVHEKLRFWQKKRLIARYFQYRLWFADLMREKLLILSDTFGVVDFMQEKLILTEQRNSLDSFNIYYDLFMHEQLIYRTKGVPWYLPIYCDLLWEKLILTEQGLRMIPFNMLWFVVWETYVFNKVISTRDYLVLRSL